MSFFPVSVKESNGRNNYMINVGTNWSVAEVKQEILRQSGLQLNQFKLVFAGQELKDTMTLEDLGIQSTSTLHCVRGNFTANVEMQRSSRPVHKVPLGSIEPSAESQKTHFYVFCKKPCGAMAPGKLRVRCSQCKDSSFVLDRGPGGWEDVLTPRHMRGQCHSGNCRGTTAEFYFKCGNHQTLDDDSSVPLHMIRVNDVKVPCITCFDVRDVVVVFDCDVGHSMCIRCYVDYIEDALNNRRFKEHRQLGYTIQCPAGCDGSEIKEIHHFRIMGAKNYERYQRFGAEECLREMGGIFCPKAGCGNGLLPEPGQRRVQCNECRHTFCAQCRRDFHTGRCDAAPATQQAPQAENTNRFTPNPRNVQQARWAEANDRYVRENSKPCPHCHSPIEKNGGCNHMTCAICRFEFCWLCLVEWNGNCQGSHWFY